MLLLKPVCESVHVFSVVLEHKDDGRLPDSAVLLERVRIWSVDGNVEGIGGWRLLSSRCSSVSAENEDLEQATHSYPFSSVSTKWLSRDAFHEQNVLLCGWCVLVLFKACSGPAACTVERRMFDRCSSRKLVLKDALLD